MRQTTVKPLTAQQIAEFEDFERWQQCEKASKAADRPKQIVFDTYYRKWRVKR